MNEVDDGGEALSNKKDTIQRLDRWVAERIGNFPPKLMEANARSRIAKSAKKDIETSGEIGEVEYRLQYVNIVRKLERHGINDDVALKSDERKDSITGEAFYARIRKDGDFYVAEEISGEGKVISQSKISQNKNTQLTLNFRTDRYERLEANPGINRDSGFPRAALNTFGLLLDTFEIPNK